MTQPATDLAWVRSPKRARSRAAAERFHAVAEELLEEGAWEQASVDEILRLANSSLPAFQARFRDKEGLLRSLHEQFIAEAEATADAVLSLERWQDCSIPEIIRETVAFTVQTYRERERLIRAFLVYSGTSEDFRARSLDLSLHIGELLRKLVLARRKELLHPAPAIAAEFSARLIHGLLVARTLSGDGSGSGNITLDDEQVTTEMIHAVLAYLGVFSTDTWNS